MDVIERDPARMGRSKGTNMNIGTFKTAAEAHGAYLATKRNNHEGCTI